MREVRQGLRRHEMCRRAPGPLAAGPGGHVFLSSYESLYACGVCGAEFKEVVDAKNGVISSSNSWVTWCVFVECTPAVFASDPQRLRERRHVIPGPRPPGALG